MTAMEDCRFLEKFNLYETSSKFYLVGRDKSGTLWRVLKINRLEPTELTIDEDPTHYTDIECQELLHRIDEGNKPTGGLKFVKECYGIVGFVKFLGPYYMLLITGRREIGTICGHVVYAVCKSEIITIPSPKVWSNVAYPKDDNRSSVYFICKSSVIPIVIPWELTNSSKLPAFLCFVLGPAVVLSVTFPVARSIGFQISECTVVASCRSNVHLWLLSLFCNDIIEIVLCVSNAG